MQTNSNFNISLWAENFPQLMATQALKTISTEDFAALGADRIVYARMVSAQEVETLFPQALSQDFEGSLQLLMTAAGVPVLVTDNEEALGDWLDQHEVTLVQLH